jgi:large subunit ribosomal protein L28
MSKICFITGKHPQFGHNVSHSNRKTSKKFLPNIQMVKIWSQSNKKFYRLKISSKGLKFINKIGIEKIIKWKNNGKKNKNN